MLCCMRTRRHSSGAILPVAGLELGLSCTSASAREPTRSYVIGETAVSIPADTEGQVYPNVDFSVHVLSNRRLQLEMGIYEGFQPDFEKDPSREPAVTRERIGAFPAWRIAQTSRWDESSSRRDAPGYCGAEILVEVGNSDRLADEAAPYLHFFYQSTNPDGCRQAERIVAR